MTIKKFISHLVLIAALFSQTSLAFSADAGESVIDDSLRDITVVAGLGAVGAVLGLSTLSFVETPSEHLKNIAVGGAIGVVVGVAVVIFTQATKSTSVINTGLLKRPITSEEFATQTRQEFSDFKIAKNYLRDDSLGVNFSF